jgi:hypothetical protein
MYMYLELKFGDDPAISSGVIALSWFSKMATWWPYLSRIGPKFDINVGGA